MGLLNRALTAGASRLAWPVLKAGGEPTTWEERWTGSEVQAPVDLWIHSASLGEITPYFEIIAQIEARIGITVTSGRSLDAVINKFSDIATVRAFPIPHGPGFENLLNTWCPQRLILLEAEAWPALLETVPEKIPSLAVLNGRIKLPQKTAWRSLLRRMPPEALKGIWVEAEDQAENYRQIGCPSESVHAGFSAKLMTRATPCDEQFRSWKQASMAHLVAGSIHPADATVLAKALAIARTTQNAKLIVVPRHPDKAGQIEAPFKASGLSVQRWPDNQPDIDVTVVAEFGILAGLYELADISIVGGAWEKAGGHNLVEAVLHNKPVIIGPHHYNQQSIIPQLGPNIAIARTAQDLAALLRPPKEVQTLDIAQLQQRSLDMATEAFTL